MTHLSDVVANQPLSDEAFVAAFKDCTLPKALFRHRQHLRLAWLYLQESPYDAAAARMEQSIRRFAGYHGVSDKYHHTLTLVWMRLVAHARRLDRGTDGFDAFLDRHPHLLDQAAPRRYFSEARLESAAARAEWVDPDLCSLPD